MSARSLEARGDHRDVRVSVAGAGRARGGSRAGAWREGRDACGGAGMSRDTGPARTSRGCRDTGGPGSWGSAGTLGAAGTRGPERPRVEAWREGWDTRGLRVVSWMRGGHGDLGDFGWCSRAGAASSCRRSCHPGFAERPSLSGLPSSVVSQLWGKIEGKATPIKLSWRRLTQRTASGCEPRRGLLH